MGRDSMQRLTQRMMERVRDLWGLSPDEITLVAVGLAVVACLLLTWGIALWMRRLLRAWVHQTRTGVDDQILPYVEYALLPLLALGVVYVLFALVPLPRAFVPLGKRLLLAGVTVLAVVSATRVLLRVLEWLGTRYGLPKSMAQGGHGPIRALVFVALLSLLSNYFLDLSEATKATLRPLLRSALIVCFAWLLVRGLTLVAQVLGHTYRARVHDLNPARLRSVETLLSIAQYVTSFIVVLIATGAALSQFTFFQTLAGSLLASAGIAGLVLGLAAQRSLGNVFAGIQLALTQPVRLRDQVVFEGEWGTVEEISLSHVIIRTWDLRRLVVPITYLLDRPIQNWTRASPELIGTVYIYTDYRVDVAAVRQAYERIVQSTPLWNRAVPPVLQVTDCKQDTVELRVLCSAADASRAWDLRCFVREQLLAYLQSLDNGAFLPRTRVLHGSAPSSAAEQCVVPQTQQGASPNVGRGS